MLRRVAIGDLNLPRSGLVQRTRIDRGYARSILVRWTMVSQGQAALADHCWENSCHYHHHRWIKRGRVLEHLQADEELEIGVIFDLLHQFFVGEAQPSLDD